MKKGAFLAVLMIFATAPAHAQDVLEGIWKTAPQEDGSYGFVKIAPCGSAFCGVLVKGVSSAGDVATSGGNIGKQILWDMRADGGGAYSGGKIWSPDQDKTYNSKLQLSGDALAVSGCVLGICRDGGIWTRSN